MKVFKTYEKESQENKRTHIDLPKKIIEWADKNLKLDLSIWDPCVLNDYLDPEWTYNSERIRLLTMLGNLDKEENRKNKILSQELKDQ